LIFEENTMRQITRFAPCILFLIGAAAHSEAQRPGPRVYISADMEGIAGLVDSRQLSLDGRDYGMGRKLMTAEVNAAIDALFRAGASDVLVNDSHGSQINLLPDEIDRRARHITGSPKPFGMMQGVDGGFDAAVFIGYHARASTTDAVHDHTYNGQLKSVKLNGTEVGEYGLNAALAGHHGVPVIFISGDQAVAEQARSFIPGVEALSVKEGIGSNAALTLHPEIARERIGGGVVTALGRLKEIRPVKLTEPVTIEIELANSRQADNAMMVPEMKRLSGRVVSYLAKDMAAAYKVSRLVASLSSLN
jgi:D-amino peptidase